MLEEENKIREIKERLRGRIGDYGTTGGVSLRERVRAKLAN